MAVNFECPKSPNKIHCYHWEDPQEFNAPCCFCGERKYKEDRKDGDSNGGDLDLKGETNGGN
jgi:hypothetical protein